MMADKIFAHEQSLLQATTCIQNLLNFNETLEIVVQQIQRFLNIDRIKIYRFSNDGSGEVIAESVNLQRLPSLLGLHFPAKDIPSYAREQFTTGRQRVIVDVAARRKTLGKVNSWNLERNEAERDIRYTSVAPCHVQYLLAMGVVSSLSVPIFYEDELWGLLVAHHSDPRHYTELELQTIQLLSNQVSIAVAQSMLMAQAQEQVRQEQALQQIRYRLSTATHLPEIWPTVLQESVDVLGGDSGRLYIAAGQTKVAAQIYTCGEQPARHCLEEYGPWKQWVMPSLQNEREGSLPQTAIDCLPDSLPIIGAIADFARSPQFQPLAELFTTTEIQSVLVVPLQYRDQHVGYLTIFRKACEVSTLWAGASDQDHRNQGPRQSFAAWCEVKQRVPSWSSADLGLAQSLGRQYYMAIIQQELEYLTQHQASYDVVTRLPNWMLFEQKLALALIQTQQAGDMLAVATLNIGRFKTVNDTFGHAGGNYLLQSISERLRDYLLSYLHDNTLSPFLARWHGDGFILLLPNLYSAEDIHKAAHCLLSSFEEPFCFQGQELYLTANLGIALAPYDGETADILVKHAEAALHQARRSGQQTYQIYAPEMTAQNLERLTLEADLHRALERDEFFLEYQPQLDLKTGQITGLEALVRWQHPRRGLLPPGEFISIAEEIGLIVALGEWVLRAACLQYRSWQLAGVPPVHISVNLSAKQFQDCYLLQNIAQILQETEMPPQLLELEITENTVVHDVEHAIATLQQLKDMGIRIAIDDFGMGYSSFGVLKHFPLDILKIDKSFIQDLEHNPSDAAIATAIVALAQGLNLQVLAEGVETEAALEFLQSIQCDLIQGYLISRPLQSDAVVKLLVNSSTHLSTSSYWPLKNLAIAPTQLDQPGLVQGLQSLATAATEHSLIATRQELAHKILEYEQLKQEVLQQTQREQLVMEIALKIRQSLDLNEILNTTVTEVRQLLQTDRVILYRFNSDWSGHVVVESVSPDYQTILGEKVDDPCFRDRFVKYYRQGRIRAIENIYEADLAPCHIEVLARYQVKANLVVPVIHQDQLWGLMIAHHCQGSRTWEPHEITLLSELATQAAIAIHQGELYGHLKETNRRLEMISTQDGLTQLANRRRFDQYLREEWRRAARSQTPISLILCDIDYFKAYNDTYGHPSGDICLQQVSSALKQGVKRPADLVARYGGEEFAIILPNTFPEGAARVAEEMRVRVRALGINHSASPLQCLTLSLGLSGIIPGDEDSPTELIALADRALYQAKAEGRDRLSWTPMSTG